MPFTVIIPARFASTRLPGKPLLLIKGKPMIQHVYEQALKSDATQVIVATDDPKIVAAVQSFGGEVCMTSATHLSGTDRIQEVAQRYALSNEDIVVNVQGDEPCIPPEVINQVAYNLRVNIQAVAATLSEPITESQDFTNPNVVKVVADHQHMALYFSRAPIPYPRDTTLENMVNSAMAYPQRHIGIYSYRVELLHRFIDWSPAPLEQVESLEQLRILYYGEKIHVQAACRVVPGGIDTPEDLERIRLCQ
jgi:3-deoxy-manno-octulosonate cytidylyltransferase (CMP-KDO synthetase)